MNSYYLINITDKVYHYILEYASKLLLTISKPSFCTRVNQKNFLFWYNNGIYKLQNMYNYCLIIASFYKLMSLTTNSNKCNLYDMLKRSILEGLKNSSRSLWLSITAIVVLTVSLSSVALVIGLSVTVGYTVRNLDALVSFPAFFKETVTEEAITTSILPKIKIGRAHV